MVPPKSQSSVSAAELAQARNATSMQSPEHLKQWLDQTGRRWIVINAQELVDALPWPSGIAAFTQVLDCYRDHRRTIDSGRRGMMFDPGLGEDVEVTLFKDETLEVEELDRAIRYLMAQIYEKKPDWKITDPDL